MHVSSLDDLDDWIHRCCFHRVDFFKVVKRPAGVAFIALIQVVKRLSARPVLLSSRSLHKN